MLRLINELLSDSVNESYLHSTYNDIEHSTQLSALQLIQIDLNSHLSNVWLSSKCRDGLLRLLAYCNLRINLFKKQYNNDPPHNKR